jgi:hypothetical protein
MIRTAFRLIVIALFANFSTAIAQEVKYKAGIIGFYNLENLFDTINQPDVNDEEFTPTGGNLYTPTVYLDKLEKLSDVLSQIGSDISPDGLSVFGVAEIENITVLQDLVAKEKLKDRKYKIVHFDSPDKRGIDVGLIYNPKYFNPLYAEPLFVPLIGDDGDPYFTRDVLYVYGMYDGEPMHFFVNHWPSRRGGEEASAPSRALAAGVAQAKIDSINKVDPNAKIILMGDLNDDPTSPSVTRVVKSVGDIKRVKPGIMFNPWVKFYNDGIGTLAYNDSWNLFDQIIISEPFMDRNQSNFFFQKAMIFSKEFMLQKTGRYRGYPFRTFDFSVYQGGYSDHLPTYILLLKPVK